jgi:hypothetical protein
MKSDKFDRKIIAARPDGYRSNTLFTDAVMAKVRSGEILSSSVRNMNVTKKETFMMRFKHLPTFAIVAIIIASILVVSGGAYAAYQLLWPKPEVHISEPKTSASGRKEVDISSAKCGKPNYTDGYELKRNATITIDEVPMVVKAHCELDAIDTWANKTFPNSADHMPFDTREPFDMTHIWTSMATHIKSRSSSDITFVGLAKYNQTDSTFNVTSNTRFIADGHDVAASAISADDPVVYITSESSHITPDAGCNGQHCSMSSSDLVKKLVAVVKLSMPFQYYDQFAWQSLAERIVCMGNPDEKCLTGYVAGVDLYQGSPEVKMGESEMREIQGVVTEIGRLSITVRASSGALYTFATPTDIVSAYNSNRAAQYYNNLMVNVGSTLSVTYVEKIVQHEKSIPASSLQSVVLRGEIISKGDPLKSY